MMDMEVRVTLPRADATGRSTVALLIPLQWFSRVHLDAGSCRIHVILGKELRQVLVETG
jgi:hypothetical protein